MEKEDILVFFVLIFFVGFIFGIDAYQTNSTNYGFDAVQVQGGGNSSSESYSSQIDVEDATGNSSSENYQADIGFWYDYAPTNTTPTVSLVSPPDNSATNDRTPTFQWSGYDAEGDSLVYELNITLDANSLCVDPEKIISDLSSESYTLPEGDYLKCLYDNSDTYLWKVRASQDSGETWGNWSETWRLNITSHLVLTAVNDTVNFGTMNISETSNTTDDSPGPFLLQNDGNCEVNVSLNSSSLWTSVSHPSSYYQYKIDNKSGEEGSFNSSFSQINWAQMPALTGNAIANLNWLNSTDLAEVDVLVEVPSTESPGSKSSTIYFISSLSETW
ncbi:hypothetical protein K9L16_02355 [Candidatus Pacearchaeota archaeon]|nr:hypothetical protein [Candidatus Pacearchaeota archaeon]